MNVIENSGPVPLDDLQSGALDGLARVITEAIRAEIEAGRLVVWDGRICDRMELEAKMNFADVWPLDEVKFDILRLVIEKDFAKWSKLAEAVDDAALVDLAKAKMEAEMALLDKAKEIGLGD